jgi:hypothetical protein
MPGWLDLANAATYASLSVCTLRKYLTDSSHRLPAHLVGGKWLIAPADLDRWVKSFPRAGADIDQMVETVMRDLGLQPHRTRKEKDGVHS